jgi:stage III sporulation protein AG
MEVTQIMQKIPATLLKYRYALLILVIGILFMLIPSNHSPKNNEEIHPAVAPVEVSAEEKLGNILGKIQGAGRVEVILSYASGAQTRYQENTATDGDSLRSEAVIVNDSSRNQTALITRVDPPVYLGAVVVCQGADSASVRLAIVDAVSKYTGLGADQIAVLKMK